MAQKAMVAVVLVWIFVWSAQGTNLNLRELSTGFSGIVDILSRAFPPDFSILPRLAGPIIETIQISIWGTTLGVMFAIPLGLLSARNISPYRLTYYASRLILNTARAIPEMIFAIVFVAAVGLGPFPGVLALAFHSAGMMGKFLADSIEHTDPGPIEALMATGARKSQIIVHAVVPQIMPEFVSLSLFRWEMNFRSSTILGIVGAGGIGFELITSMRLFFYQQLTVILIAILVIVTMVDGIATFIRKRII
ncbi:MAG TPA: phosphonate ABC transporter, permease protein PhnE [Desulfobacterales bacterium]|nr:phosphonate ABC transporter, permease protein PhnE [Desulfobacterales bacterium]